MPTETLTMKFAMYVKTDDKGEPLDLYGNKLQRSDPDFKKKVVFVPVLVKVKQDGGDPADDLPDDPADVKQWENVPKAFLSPQGWRNPADEDHETNLYDTKFNPKNRWKGSKFPNNILDKV